jgi:hypothetical protein
MNSIEALWLVGFADVSAPSSIRNGGVMILETNRLFGGDSAFAYVGNYDVNGNQVSGELTITKFNDEIIDVWEIGFSEIVVMFSLERADERMVGRMKVAGGPELPVVLTRFRDLP